MAPVTFKAQPLFDSGPCRIDVGRRGKAMVDLFRFGDPSLPGSVAVGDIELQIIVRGRLIAPTDVDLWSLRDAIAAQAAFSAGAGTLEDGRGRAWNDMLLIRFEEDGPVARGRSISVGYSCTFRRLLGA